MKRPPNFNKFQRRYDQIKENPSMEVNDTDKAVIMIVEFQLAIEKGNKHFHPVTNALLPDVLSIIHCLKTHGSISIEPTKGDTQ